MYAALILLVFLASAARISAECANGCNGHGKCTSYDMCICNRNWQANDCSERVCMFGLAHVDTPKGDLDMSGDISGPYTTVAEDSSVYPYGTTEMFPEVEDSAHNVISNSAHYYMECSNKGTCTRTTGECNCYPGYEGVACQRASCPGSPVACSGHGVCKSIQQIAESTSNVYELWDKDTTMGCDCDPGFTGPDCSLMECKHGVDPLYLDDTATVKYSSFNFAQFVANPGSASGNNAATRLADFNDGTPTKGTGHWAIRFYDSFGEDWLTAPIQAGAICDDVVKALEALPNNVIPKATVVCTRTVAENVFENGGFSLNYQNPWRNETDGTMTLTDEMGTHAYYLQYKMAMWEAVTPALISEDFAGLNAPIPLFMSSWNKTTAWTSSSNPYGNPSLSGYIYHLQFLGNPGKLKEPEIELYLDGLRPSLSASPSDLFVQGSGSESKVITKVWTDGQQGEDSDYFGDHCDGVTVHIGYPTKNNVPLWQYPNASMRYEFYLTSFTPKEKALLKACLGSADFDTSNNLEVYNWDFGTRFYPHLIRLVRSVSTYMDGGYYAALWYDDSSACDPYTRPVDNTCSCSSNVMSCASGYGTGGTFRLLNPFVPPDAAFQPFGASFTAFGNNATTEHDSWEIYTTKGTLALTSDLADASFSFGSKHIFTTNVDYETAGTSSNPYTAGQFNGDLSCESNTNTSMHCLNVTDIFTVFSWTHSQYNPRYLNLYTVESIKSVDFFTPESRVKAGGIDTAWSAVTDFTAIPPSDFMTHVITTDISTNWGVSIDSTQSVSFQVYKFFPAAESTYDYVGECSNRGVCDQATGICSCFGGYTGDSCSEQNQLHL